MLQKFFGAFLFISGIVLILKTQWFLENFGRIPWAEEKLGVEGGTRFFYKILGILMIFFGLTMVFGMFGGIIYFIFDPLIPG